MGGEDAEEHGEGVDGGVAGVGELAAIGGYVVGEGQCWGVGMHAADDTHEGIVVDFQHQTAEEAEDDGRDDGDDESVDDPHIAASLDGGDEAATSAETHASEEEGDANLAQHPDTMRVGELRCEPAFLDSQPAADKGSDEGTSGQTELDGSYKPSSQKTNKQQQKLEK